MQWDAALYDDKHSFVATLGKGALEWLEPQPGERILDVGCGTGHLTAEITEVGATVVGLDSSAEMIRIARRTYPKIDWIQASATNFRVEEPFDAIFSNAALHWIKPPEEAVRCIAAACRPGGRLVLEMGGKENVRKIADAIAAVTGADHPWFFPSIAEYSNILERHGFEVRQAVLFDRPTPLEGPDGLRNWVKQFGSSMVADIKEDELPHALREIEAHLAPELSLGGTWIADYRRLRIRAVKG